MHAPKILITQLHRAYQSFPPVNVHVRPRIRLRKRLNRKAAGILTSLSLILYMVSNSARSLPVGASRIERRETTARACVPSSRVGPNIHTHIHIPRSLTGSRSRGQGTHAVCESENEVEEGRPWSGGRVKPSTPHAASQSPHRARAVKATR